MDPGGGPAIWLLALQQDGASGNGLSFFSSDDEAQSFSYLAAIQPDWSERDEADLLPVGNDVALTYSYEGPSLSGSSRHDVYFQWWRYAATARTWRPSAPVLVFDSTSDSTAYSRAEIARDSSGRIWIQAFRLEADGTSSAAIAVSEDGGASFRTLPDLDNIPRRGGGRLLWLGDRLVFVYAMHDGFLGTHFRIHQDWDPPDVWQPVTLAFSEGIYHGAALSAVADGKGGMHLVYKNENDQDLYYRYFDGSSFGPATLLDTSDDWALQPAITLIGKQLYIFYNHMFSSANYDFRYRIYQNGAFTDPVVLTSTQDWKGYPNAVDVLPDRLTEVPGFFGETPTAADNGVLSEVFAAHAASASADGGSSTPPDAGSATPDAGSTVSDAGSATTTGTLFSDNFNRTGGDSAALGSRWTTQGLWYAQNEAITDLDGTDLAIENVARCADCTASATVDGFGVPHIGLVLRASSTSGGNRYQLDLLGNGHLQIQRVVNGSTTVLADVASGLSDPSSSAKLSLTATGSAPVQLSASVNGRALATASDTSSSAPPSGYAGMFSQNAGVWFDDFALTGTTTTSTTPDAGPADGGPSDAGQIDAGPPDAGAADAGPADAGPADGGPADAGPADAGPIDAGPYDAGATDAGSPPSDAGSSTGVLFSDAFQRTSSDSTALGPSWNVQGLWYAQNAAISDLDGTDLALENVATCRDCQVSATVVGFGVPHAALVLRASSSGTTRYQLDLLGNGHLQIQRVSSGTITVLADVPSGIADPSSASSLALVATGAGPVQLTASINGSAVATATDSSGSALVSAGSAGLYTGSAGVVFKSFVLSGTGTTSLPDAGSTTPDAGSASDAGSTKNDAGSTTIDAGSSGTDAGSSGTDAGPSDAGAAQPDAGTTTGTLFTDSFNRTGSDSAALGGSWATQGLWYTQNEAISDLDGTDLAVENVATCRDCQASVKLDGFGVPHTAVFLRASSNGTARYQLDLLGNGHLQIQRVVNGSTTVLADVASGLSDSSAAATLVLAASGAGPVSLTASLNGAPIASATDSSSAALTAAGYAGLYTSNAGVWFDDFTLAGTGTPSSPSTDAGLPADAGSTTGAGSGTLSLQVDYTDTSHRILAVDPSGTAYAADLSGGNTVLASVDGRSWSARGDDSGAYFAQMTALADGTLLADVIRNGTHYLARSTNAGASWTDVQGLGSYRALTPHNWGELDGEVFFIEYQDFTTSSTTLHLWVSDDDGRTWSVRNTFTTHRHGHGLVTDPARHALWIYFGDTDAQSGIYRSTDAGQSFTLVLGSQPGDVVDAVVLGDGSLLFGQDISYLPPTPHIATLSPSGAYQELASLTGPSYSIHALSGGGYVVGAEREPGGDIYPSGEVSAHVYVSADGVSWQRALDYPRLTSPDNARADVYWELPSGELVLQLENIEGFGAQGKGYQLLRVVR